MLHSCGIMILFDVQCIGNNDLNDPLDLKETDPTIVNFKYPETDIVHSKLNDKIDNKETLCPRVDLTTSYYAEPDGTDTNFELGKLFVSFLVI